MISFIDIIESFTESNIVIGGNPAKKIATFEGLREKYAEKAVSLIGLSKEQRCELRSDDSILVKR